MAKTRNEARLHRHNRVRGRVNGTPEQVREKVSELLEIFPTGLIISPSHEAILPDIPPANIKAIFDLLKELSR